MGETVRFIKLQIEENVFRRRWLLILPISIFISSNETSRVLAQTFGAIQKFNTWDVLFSVFSNANYLFFVTNGIFLYLICDLSTEKSYGQMVLLKLGSRKQWWVGKVAALGAVVLIYIAVNVGISACIASFAFPWQSFWSESAHSSPSNFYLNPILLNLNPTLAFSWLLLFLALGWFGLGLLVINCSQFLDNHILGFITGILINFVSLIIYKLNIQSPFVDLSFHQHMLINLLFSGQNHSLFVSFGSSLIYWVLWFTIFLFLGFVYGRQKDFFRRESGS